MASSVWKLNGRRGIAYVESREAAEKVIALRGEINGVNGLARLEGAAMAEYRDKRGKAFAWQIPFDLPLWDAVSDALGMREPSSV